jgi:hypothetical protein
MRRDGLCIPIMIGGLAVLSCLSTVSDPSFDNPFDPHNGSGLPAPDSIVVTVGNNIVHLAWGSAGTSADEFAVFRRRTDEENGPGPEDLVARVHTRWYVDAGVRNEHSYEYRIAAGQAGEFGERSDFIAAQPGLYTLVIADDAPKTRTRVVLLSLHAPGAEAVRLFEGPDSTASTWRQAAASVSWTLSSGDGEKTVYGVFRLMDGSITSPASDRIVLDTEAVVRALEFDGNDVRQPGDAIHFRLDAGEPRGQATVDVAGVFTALALFDDGTNGDSVPADAVYEREATIPAGHGANAATVTGHFTDEAGNTASLDAGRTLSVRKSPDAVSLMEPIVTEPPDAAAVKLRWTQSLATDFAAYRVYRAQTADVDSSDRLVGSVSPAVTLELADRDVVEGDTYWYRVYVVTSGALQAGSNRVQTTVVNARSPAAVTVESPEAVGTTRLSLRWSRSQETDFQSYLVYRSLGDAVTGTDTVLATITPVGQTYFDDMQLIENTAYSYRVDVRDRGGLVSRSNPVKATTENEPPPAVVLAAATDIDTTAATLTWGASTVHDFAYYRLYRDETPTVTTASTRVVEIDLRDATTFRDHDLKPSTTYYYRVFVVDDGTNPGPKSTGSNAITLTTSSAATRMVYHVPHS